LTPRINQISSSQSAIIPVNIAIESDLTAKVRQLK
jgi:hypothetical protein